MSESRSESRPVDLDRLLAGQEWAQALAGGLLETVGPGNLGEAWLLARGHVPREPGAWRGFLTGVARNLRRSAQRGEQRRRQRETLVAQPEALPSAAELVERAELRRLLVDSVLALEEAERTAILLRYFEGLTAEEIARRAGVPAATVRSRLRRGLARLREGLESRAPRRDLLAGLVLLAHPVVPAVPTGASPTAASGLPWLGGILAMKTLLTVVAACAALLTLVAGLRWLDRDTSGAEEPAKLEQPLLVAGPELDAVPGEPVQLEVVPAERTAVASAPAALEVVPDSAPVLARLVARVLDTDGRPLAGVAVSRGDERLGKSGPQGRVEVELEPRRKGEVAPIEFTRDGFARALRQVRLSAGEVVQLGNVTLPAAVTLRGRVEDERGMPLAGVRVIADALENPRSDPEELRRMGPLEQELWVAGVSGPRGEFELAGVPLGSVRVWGGKESYAWTSSAPLEVVQEGMQDLVLVLEPLERADRIAGRVLAPDGTPVPRARIDTWFTAASYGTGGRITADGEGRFEILLQARVAHDLTISDPENRWSELYHFGVEPGERDLEFVFEPARWMDVSVLTPDGEAVEDFSLELQSATGGNWLRMATRLQEQADEQADEQVDGNAQVRIPNATFRLQASALGRELAVRGPFQPDAVPESIEFTLAALPGVHGVVLSAAGDPVSGAEVGLYRLVADRIESQRNGFRLVTESYTEAKTTTDADGGFLLYPPFASGGAYVSSLSVLRAEAPGHATTELAAREFDPREGAEVELRLVHGGAIEGRAVLAPGVDPTGILLAFSRGDGTTRTRRLGPDGLYREGGLTPGPWEVRVLEDEPGGNRSTSSSTLHDDVAPPFDNWSCVVVDGETTYHDVDLSDLAPCTLQGELLLGGRSFGGWTASFEQKGIAADHVLASVPLDEDGCFELVSPRGGLHRLVLRGPEEGNGRLELREQLELSPGVSEWHVELAPGRLEGSGALGRGTRERFTTYSWLGSVPGHRLHASVRIVPDGDGHFVLPTVPEGPGEISCNDPPADGQRIAPWEEISEFEVPAGGVRTVVLP